MSAQPPARTIEDTAAWLAARDNAGAWKNVLVGAAERHCCRAKAAQRRSREIDAQARPKPRSPLGSSELDADTICYSTICRTSITMQKVLVATAPTGNLWDNPLGTDGFEFIEYAAPDPLAMGRLFEQMGFTAVARHRSQERAAVPAGRHQLHRQRRAGFLRAVVRARARPVRSARSRSACSDAATAYRAVRSQRRVGRRGASRARWSSTFPAIKGIGDSLIYLVDRWRGSAERRHRRIDLRRRLRAAPRRRRSIRPAPD